MEEVKSPCNNNCRYDYSKNFCVGCYRTIEEIMAWSALSFDGKLLVLQKAEIRKRTYKDKFNGGN